MTKYYEFTFENEDIYTGTVADKNEFVKHLTKEEKAEKGKIISKKAITKEDYDAFMVEVERFLEYI